MVKGLDVTGFTDAEDEAGSIFRDTCFFLVLERALTLEQWRELQAVQLQGNWAANVVQDGALMTGQEIRLPAALPRRRFFGCAPSS